MSYSGTGLTRSKTYGLKLPLPARYSAKSLRAGVETFIPHLNTARPTSLQFSPRPVTDS